MKFNRECAEHVYDVVSKMDDGEAEAFALFAADDIWHQDVAKNSRYLAWKLTKDEDRRTEEVAKSLLDHLENGGDPEEAVAVAASVAIAKADGDWWKFQERDRHGRFGRMTRAEYKARVKEIKAKAGADEAAMKAGLIAERKANPHFARAERYERDIRNYKGTYRTGHLIASGSKDFSTAVTGPRDNESGATDAFQRLQHGGRVVQGIGASTGNAKLAAAGALANYAGQFGPEAEKVIGPSIRRTAYRYRGTERAPDRNLTALVKARSQALLGAEGRSTTPLMRHKVDANGKKVPRLDSNGKPVYRQSAKTPNPDAPLYSSEPGKLHGVTYKPVYETEQYVPEAREVLTPPEKTFAAEQAAIQYLKGDYKEDGVRGKSRIPSAGLAELHRKSGKITPSEGILIDADGNIVAQSVGFAEDHYLPFNLKNMSALKGGSYVRTRESGGLTTEDIYAGLMSGARSMTVVSNSGTFTVDFDDALRGGRRYSDKARSMVDRYQATLDAVQSEQVRKLPISAREKAEVREEVDREVEAMGLQPWEYTPEMKERYYNQKLLERRANPQLTSQEYQAIERESWKGLNRNRPSDQDVESQRRIFRQLERRALAAKGQPNYKLDGEGYKAALDALQEQFPYFVSGVKVQANRDDPESFNDSVDLGYVKPRFNRPTAVQVGFYGQGVGSPKRSAEETGYQNWRARREGKLTAVAREEETPTATGERVVAPGQAREEHSYQESVQAAEAQRAQTTAHAASWWGDALKRGGTPLPKHLAAMDQMPSEQRAAYAGRHYDEIKAEIDDLKQRAQAKGVDVSMAPKVIYNPPEPPRQTNPTGVAPSDVANGDVTHHMETFNSVIDREPRMVHAWDKVATAELEPWAAVYEARAKSQPDWRSDGGVSWAEAASALRGFLAVRKHENLPVGFMSQQTTATP